MIRGILEDVIETISIQKTVEAHAADASNQQFSYMLREMKFSANSIRLGIDSWLTEMKQLKLKSLELSAKVGDFGSDIGLHSFLLVYFSLAQETIADLDYMLDGKENILERLHDEYKIAEDQYERSVTAHKNLLDQFIGKSIGQFSENNRFMMMYFAVIHTGFIESFQKGYENEIDQMIQSFFVECHARERIDKACKMYSMNVMHGKNLLTRYTLTKKIEKFTRQKNQLKSNAIVRSECLVSKNKQHIEQIYNEAVKVIQLLSDCFNGKQNENAYRLNKSRNEIDRNHIEELEEKIFMRKDYLRKLNAKFKRSEEYITENMTELKSRYKTALDRNNMLQSKAKLIYQGMDDDLKHMVTVANDSTRELDKQAKMCRNIVTTFNICRKSMTMHERLHCGSNIGCTPCDDITELDLFWHEFGIIGNSILMLEKEFSRLQMENNILQNKIRGYMSEHKTSKFAF